MKKYNVIRANQVFIALEQLILNKAQYDIDATIRFRNKMLQEID